MLNWKPRYLGHWDDGLEMASDFAITDLNKITKYNIAVADYEVQCYEGDANVVLYREAWQREERSWMLELYYVSGGHCSCYGLEGQWEPERIHLDQLKKMAVSWSRDFSVALLEFIANVESYINSEDGRELAPISEEEGE